MKTFTQDATPERAEVKLTDTGDMVPDGKGGTVAAVSTWRGPLEQIDRHDDTFKAHGMKAGDVSALRDQINEAKKQRDS